MGIRESVHHHVAVPRTIYVLATSEANTAVALEVARPLVADQGAALVVLVPHVVPFGTDLARCGHDLTRLGEPSRAAVLASGVSATIRVCACREATHVFSRLLIDRAHVVVAGRRGRWWRSRDERLARALECEGHHVVFVDVNASDTPVDALAGPRRPRLRLIRPSTARTTTEDRGERSYDSGERLPDMALPPTDDGRESIAANRDPASGDPS